MHRPNPYPAVFFFLGINWEKPQTQSACHSAEPHGINELVCFRLLTDFFQTQILIADVEISPCKF